MTDEFARQRADAAPEWSEAYYRERIQKLAQENGKLKSALENLTDGIDALVRQPRSQEAWQQLHEAYSHALSLQMNLSGLSAWLESLASK